jgi:hypothetical protein
MGNWIPNDPTLVAQILKISASYSPPPPEGFDAIERVKQRRYYHARVALTGLAKCGSV